MQVEVSRVSSYMCMVHMGRHVLHPPADATDALGDCYDLDGCYDLDAAEELGPETGMPPASAGVVLGSNDDGSDEDDHDHMCPIGESSEAMVSELEQGGAGRPSSRAGQGQVPSDGGVDLYQLVPHMLLPR